MTGYISVYITAATPAEAENIAQALINQRLAACVNMLPAARSLYRWQGRVEAAEETILIAKGRAAAFASIERLVKLLSSYDCPCIVAAPIVEGHKPYLDWLERETTPINPKKAEKA